MIDRRFLAVVPFLMLAMTVPSSAQLALVDAAPVGFAQPSPAVMLNADLDGDGRPEILVGESAGLFAASAARVFDFNGGQLSGPGAAIQAGVLTTLCVAAGDLDDNGAVDLVIAGQGLSSSGVYIALNQPAAAGFVTSAWPSASVNIAAIALGDADGDGDLDLFELSSSGLGTVRVYTNDGEGVFSFSSSAAAQAPGSLPPLVLAAEHRGLLVADLNGDGRADAAVLHGAVTSFQLVPTVMVATVESNSVTVLINDGSGQLLLGTTIGVGPRPLDVTAGDLDGDGRPELAVACHGGLAQGRVDVAWNDGAGGFSSLTSVAASDHPHDLAFADIDGDFDRDLVVVSTTGVASAASIERAFVFWNDGAASTGIGTSLVPPPPFDTGASGVAAADLDADGVDEIILLRPGHVGVFNGPPRALPLHPGTGDDLELWSGPPTELSSIPPGDVAFTTVGSPLVLQVISPAGGFVNAPSVLAGRLVGDVGMLPMEPLPGFQHAFVPVFFDSFLFFQEGGIGPGGVVVAGIVPPIAAGTVLLVQGYSASPNANNGVWASTDAHVVLVH